LAVFFNVSTLLKMLKHACYRSIQTTTNRTSIMINTAVMQSFSNTLVINKQRISADGYGSLYFMVIISRQKKNIPLKLKWPADRIDFKAEKLLPRFKKDPDVVDYNLFIQIEKARYTEIQKMYRIKNEELTMEKFIREVSVFDTKECFLTYIDYERNRRYVRKEIEKKTFENARSCRLAIEKYDSTALFKNINLKWMQGFKAFLQREPYHTDKKGKVYYYKTGTIWRHIATAKAYLQLASQEPMIFVDDVAIGFPNPKPDIDTTYLNRVELKNLYLLLDDSLTDDHLTDRQERVLKAFLFTCFTSLRISDVYKANAKWEVDNGFIQFIPHKNRKYQREIKVPLLPMARQFINSTGFYFTLPNQVQYNETLKELAEKAGITKNLTSHVGRHTFGFLYMTTEGNLYGLQVLMGHRKIDTTSRYAHIDDDYKKSSTMKIQADFEDVIQEAS